jgi:hypothetical protein
VTVANAGEINDASTAVRVFEKDFAIERFKMHPVFGNGYFRASEKNKIIGRNVYFYPLDIGLYGILYSLGAIGIIVFIIQLRLVLINYNNRNSNPFHVFVILGLVFFTFSSILNGNTLNNFKAFFFFICLISLANSMKSLPKFGSSRVIKKGNLIMK